MTSVARALVEKHYEGFGEADMELSLSVHADDVQATVPGAGTLNGNAAFAEFSKPFMAGFPDAKVHVEDMIEAGDVVVVEGRFTGENTGPLATPQGELPPTGRSIDLRFADVFRVRDGKVVVHNIYFDQMEFMQQLGLMPGPEA